MKGVGLDNLSIFQEDLIALGLQGNTCEEVIELLGRLLEKSGCVKDTFIASVISREKIFATGLPLEKINVAIPHTDSIHVNRQKIAVGVLANPVQFHVMGCVEELIPVHVVFLLAIKEQDDQVVILQKLAEMIQDLSFIEKIYCSHTTEEVLNALNTKFGMRVTDAAN